ncbi:tripartite motif containing 108 [Festucalex cinctus]
MASASFADDLTCPICFTFFTDPVTLLCGHSFCRTCLTKFLDLQSQCPCCRASVASKKEVAALCTNFVLLSLAEKAKHADGNTRELITAKVEVAETCPEHDEKLKLFCVTDQQLTCIICRDGERHVGHTFKPIKEAAASVKMELKKGLDKVSGGIKNLESLLSTQRATIKSTKGRSCQLVSQISAQFAEMHQFLQKREEELKKEVRRQEDKNVAQMTKMVNAIEAELSQNRELQTKVASVLEISDPGKFLKGCAEGASAILQEAFRSRENEYSVVASALSLGPYESHLQFFVWKEMLQVIRPREEHLMLDMEGCQENLSADRCSLLHDRHNDFYNDRYSRNKSLMYHKTYQSYSLDPRRDSRMNPHRRPIENITPLFHGFATSVDEFTSGQHYWEIQVGQIEIGQGDFWEVGIPDHIITLQDGKNLSTRCPQGVTSLSLKNIPQKIGIYLNIPSQELSFYDASNMTHINTVSTKGSKASSFSALLKMGYKTPSAILFTVCRY